MKFWFSFIEGIRGIKRAKLASIITISSVAFAHLLIGLFLLFSVNINQIIGDVRSKIELEVFLEADLSVKSGKKIEKNISGFEGVSNVKYISKEDAAKRFQKDFGRNIYEVLDFNPLPPSCTVKVKKGYRNYSFIKTLSAEITKIDGVDEVKYQKEILSIIDRYITIVYIIAAIAGLILIIISVVLLYNTIRLTIYGRKDLIEIMKLVGATRAIIRRPFIVEGFVEGLVGASIASAILYGSILLIKRYIYPYVVNSVEIYIILLISGVVIGVIASGMSLAKHLQEI